MSQSDDIGGGCLLGVLVSSIFWSGVLLTCHYAWRHAATERGYGHFNQRTGDWEWVEPVKKAEEEAK